MTVDDLEAIRSRLKTASDGPWSVRRIPNSYESAAGDRHTHPCVRGFRVPRRLYNLAWQQCEHDAEFMAQARQDVPNLLAEVEHLRATLDEVQNAVQELTKRGSVSPDDLARLDQYLAEEDAQFHGPKRLREVRRLYMSQAPLRPKDAVAALTSPRKAG